MSSLQDSKDSSLYSPLSSPINSPNNGDGIQLDKDFQNSYSQNESRNLRYSTAEQDENGYNEDEENQKGKDESYGEHEYDQKAFEEEESNDDDVDIDNDVKEVNTIRSGRKIRVIDESYDAAEDSALVDIQSVTDKINSSSTQHSNKGRTYSVNQSARRKDSIQVDELDNSYRNGLNLSPSHALSSPSSYNSSSIRSSLQDSLDARLDEETRALWKRNKELNRENKDLFGEVDRVVKDAQVVQTRPKEQRIPPKKIQAAPKNTSETIGKKTVVKQGYNSAREEQVTTKNPLNVVNIDDTPKDLDEFEQATRGMGTEAQIVFYRSRVQALEAQIKNLIEESKNKEKQLGEYHKLTKEMNLIKKQNQSKSTAYEKQIERMKKEIATSQSKNESLQKTILELKNEIDSLKSNRPISNAPSGGNDVRYLRAIEELEKLKTQNKELRKEQKEKLDNARKEQDRIEQHNKKLERQKQEIMNAFNKQMKLIDILRRQKIHLEAAKMLNFSEQEFAKALDFGK